MVWVPFGIVEGYGPFLITDADPDLTILARFSNGCELIIDETKFDISEYEKEQLDFRLDTLEQLHLVLNDLQGTGSKASLIKAIIASLNPESLATMLSSLKNDLQLIDSFTLSPYSKLKMNQYISDIDSHLATLDPSSSELLELLNNLVSFYDDVLTEVTDLTSSYLVYAANVLNLAQDTVFAAYKARFEEICIEITTDAARCRLSKE